MTVGPVREWHEERTVARAGHDLKAGDAFESYIVWCNERGEKLMNLTAFGTCMRDDLKVEKFQTPSKRTYYRNIALGGKPALAVVSG